MKLKKIVLIALLGATLAAFTGCNSAKSGFEYSYVKNKQNNALGIVKSADGSFAYDEPNSLNLSSTELLPVKNPSGKEVQLLWGLVTLQDY